MSNYIFCRDLVYTYFDVYAGEAEHPPVVTITGKLGFEMYDGVKSVTINTDDSLVSGKNPDFGRRMAQGLIRLST